MIETLLEKVRAYLRSEGSHAEINGCVNSLLHGHYGRMQYFFSGKAYCCRSELYCPLQLETTKKMKECCYQELVKEMEKR